MRRNAQIRLATVAVLLAAAPALGAPNAPEGATAEAAGERTRELLRRVQSKATHRPPALRTSTLAASPSAQTVTTPAQFSLSLDGSLNLGAQGGIFVAGYPFIHHDSGTAVGFYALTNTTGGDGHNSAVGFGALYFNEEGSHNTAIGSYALRSNIGYQKGGNKGGFANTAVGYGALLANLGDAPYTASINTAVGLDALRSNVSGSGNTASGGGALRFNTTGGFNTAVGLSALYENVGGFNNTAIGALALKSNTSGAGNTAGGFGALASSSTGAFNTAIGYYALYDNYAGGFNTAIGFGAGAAWTTGSDNIAVGVGSSGAAGEEKTIRIGGNNMQTRTFIEGIANAGMTFATQVCIDSTSDQLGPCSASSARFKQDIEPLDDSRSDDLRRALAALQPVSFRYRRAFTSEQTPKLQYGLLAEEVARVFPSLVTTDETGRPHTVRYDLLTPLLLAELQRQERELAQLRRLDDEVAELRGLVDEQSRRLQKMVARSRPRANER